MSPGTYVCVHTHTWLCTGGKVREREREREGGRGREREREGGRGRENGRERGGGYVHGSGWNVIQYKDDGMQQQAKRRYIRTYSTRYTYRTRTSGISTAATSPRPFPGRAAMVTVGGAGEGDDSIISHITCMYVCICIYICISTRSC